MSELANNAELEMQRLMEPFNFDDADVVLCVRGADFRVHKLVLTHASTVFKDIFSLPRNPSTSQKSLPVIDIAEDAQTLHDVLSLIYPNAHQIDLDDLSTLHRVLLASRKYSMENLRLMLVKILQAKVDTDPVRVFAIACLVEAPQVALLAARETLKKPYVHIAKFDVPELNQIRAGTFCKLLRYHDRCGELASQTIATPAERYLVTEHSYYDGKRGYTLCQQSWWAGYIARIRQQLESRINPVLPDNKNTELVQEFINASKGCDICAPQAAQKLLELGGQLEKEIRGVIANVKLDLNDDDFLL